MRRFSVIIFLLLIANSVCARDVNVPLDHWVYSFLERMEARGLIRDAAMRCYPLTRRTVARLLVAVATGSNRLTPVELARLSQFKGEFHNELFLLNKRAQARYFERHFIRWKQDNHVAFFDIDFGQRFTRANIRNDDGSGRTSETRLGGIVRGTIGNKMGFYMHAYNTLHRGAGTFSENYNPAHGMPVGIAGSNVYSDDASAYITFSNNYLLLEYGRDQIKWGNGYNGSLVLSRENPRFEMLKLHLAFKRWQYTAFHGWLHHSNSAKYIAGHRLTWVPNEWLTLSGSETVIYSNRNIETLYLNPIMPFHVAEHHLGDRDNNTMGLEVTLFPYAGHKIYAELFLDDFNSSQNPFTYYGNKFAFMIGHHWVDPFGWRDSEIRLEYTRIEPYVYTHKDSTLRYQNYDQSIGHWLGPNADDLYIRAEHAFHRDVTAALIIERVRHGEGSIYRPHLESDGTRKQFLQGTVESKWNYGFEIVDQLFRDAFISLQYTYSKIDNAGRIAGIKATEQQAIIRFTLNW